MNIYGNLLLVDAFLSLPIPHFLLHPNPKTGIKIFQAIFEPFKSIYEARYLTIMGEKIGISETKSEDYDLIKELLDRMQAEAADYTLTFRYLGYQTAKKFWPFEEIFSPSPSLKQWIVAMLSPEN